MNKASRMTKIGRENGPMDTDKDTNVDITPEITPKITLSIKLNSSAR